MSNLFNGKNRLLLIKALNSHETFYSILALFWFEIILGIIFLLRCII